MMERSSSRITKYPQRLDEPVVSTGSRTTDLRLGHRHIDHLRAPAVAGDSHSLGIDQAFGNQFPDRILETQRAIDPDQVLHPPARQGPRRSPLRIGRDRKSAVWGRSVSVRVELGGRRIIKTKNNNKQIE